MDNPEHRQAWGILQSVPEGQKNQFVVSAILRLKEGEYLEQIVRQTVREEMQNAAPLLKQYVTGQQGALLVLLPFRQNFYWIF